MKRTIILTVPHSVCLEGSNRRTCDLLASKAANQLSVALQNLGYQVYVLQGSVSRLVVDENRYEGENTSMRNELRALMNRMHNSIYFVLDIHSFPNRTIWRKGYPSSNEEIVILDSVVKHQQERTASFMMYKLELKEALYRNGIRVGLIAGGENAITIEAKNLGLRSTLLEFNESLTDERLMFIVDIIAKNL